jgi:hypothetical protein
MIEVQTPQDRCFRDKRTTFNAMPSVSSVAKIRVSTNKPRIWIPIRGYLALKNSSLQRIRIILQKLEKESCKLLFTS